MNDSLKREEGFLGVYKCIVAMVTGGGLVWFSMEAQISVTNG